MQNFVMEMLATPQPSRRVLLRLKSRRLTTHGCLVKTQADISRIQKFARYVITVSDTGVVSVVENKLYLLNTISVVAPCVVFGTATPGLVLEVGLSKTRPYRDRFITKTHPNFAGFSSIPRRPKVRKITDDELQLVLPFIEMFLEQATAERRNGWQTKEPWYLMTSSGIKSFERGSRFTVDATDEWLIDHLVNLSVIDVRSLKVYGYTINRLLYYCKLSYYPDKRLKKMKGPCEVAKLCRGLSDLPIYQLRHLFSMVHLEKRQVLNQIGDVFGLAVLQRVNVLTLPSISHRKSSNHAFSIRLVRAGGVVEAAGCFVFELFPKPGRKLRGEVDFLDTLQSASSSDDIPF